MIFFSIIFNNRDIKLAAKDSTIRSSIFRSSPEIKITPTVFIYFIIKSQLGLSISSIHTGEYNDIILYGIGMLFFYLYRRRTLCGYMCIVISIPVSQKSSK